MSSENLKEDSEKLSTTSIFIPRWLWLKRYFDTGIGLTTYAKYLIAIFSIYSISKDIPIEWTLAAGVLYVFACIFIGWWWISSRLIDAEKEIDNLLDPFQREVRHYVNREKV